MTDKINHALAQAIPISSSFVHFPIKIYRTLPKPQVDAVSTGNFHAEGGILSDLDVQVTLLDLAVGIQVTDVL